MASNGKRLEAGRRVYVWERGYGFSTGEDIPLGTGTIENCHEGYVDDFNHHKEIIYQIKMDEGQVIHGCHHHFYNQSYYFETKEEFNSCIVRQIEDIEKNIEELVEKKQQLIKSQIT